MKISKIAIKIKVAMMRKNITQHQIAQELGISDTAVYNYIRGVCHSRRFNKWIKENLNIDLDKEYE